MNIQPIQPSFACEISGIDLSRPLTDAEVREIDGAINTFSVVVFRGQHLDDATQVAFAQRFGEIALPRYSRDAKRRVDVRLADISNLDAEHRVRDKNDHWRMDGFANQLWHTDASFRKVPAALSMLFAHKVPGEGGDTEFADLRAAWDKLPADMKATVEPLVAEHSIWHSRAQIGFVDFDDAERAEIPPVPQRVVRVHPGSKRKTLYLGAHAEHIVGWPIPEGRMLLMHLTEFATQREFVYAHRWRQGDLVIWDNRCSLHRGRPYDTTQVRDLRRAMTRDVASTLEQ